MPIFWGRGAAPGSTGGPHAVRDALLEAAQRGEAGPSFEGTIGPWIRREGDPGTDDETNPDHPAGYIARTEVGGEGSGEDLVHAVNAALLLNKPLLLTGNPGTGKSQLAERLAWEFNLGPVLRFESQSLSEAGDLFYRYDLVGRLAGVESFKAALAMGEAADRSAAGVGRHLSFGALGRAILRADPAQAGPLFEAGLAVGELKPGDAPRPSVVLIDEIDKTSRDFPNDLLNQIERKEFRIRELRDLLLRAPDDAALQPIVLITSNSERELPAPFLRRCVYFHIPDPTPAMLARILRSRVPASRAGGGGLQPLYADVLDFFGKFQRESEGSAYRPGVSEMLDLARAVQRGGTSDPAARLASPDNHRALRRASATLLKHRADGELLGRLLAQWKPG
jgi:MoxR-like ATPase